MNSKRKVVITFGALVLVIMATAIAVISVLAAQDVNVKSGITINYNPNGVIGATVKAKYKVGISGPDAWIGSSNGIPFNGDETNGDYQLGNAEINELYAGEAFVTFTFMFKNDGANSFEAGLLYIDNSDRDYNMSIEYQGTTDLITVEVENLIEIEDGSHVLNFGSPVRVDPGQEVEFVVKVKVTSEAKVAHFSGDFSWNLKALTVANN